jgi:hypothetical protein
LSKAHPFGNAAGQGPVEPAGQRLLVPRAHADRPWMDERPDLAHYRLFQPLAGAAGRPAAQAASRTACQRLGCGRRRRPVELGGGGGAMRA